ncbi:sugar phosphate isomerase/epimerase [Xanthobacter autotrophicus]|uniref:sugar phosphate isomerase/epimerase family protein n=1 Tax=Xanthobacter autotrophicus TaxID=280 RepID=UPI001E651C86|nr:sugar phosphate isomerase/epimerase family protein [Xanthobacter autotrophicus]UDQ90249.1 sugar phosphate isomerase/epimerase [Xanthobacter autotrophicus]
MTGLSINHYITPPGYALERFLDDCAAAGATGVGLTERALDEVALPDLQRMLDARGLTVSSVNSAGFFLWGDPERAQRQAAVNAALIHAAAVLSAGTLVTIGGGLDDLGPQPPGVLAHARCTVAAALPALRDAAGARGVRLGLETMHPIRIPTKSTLNTLTQAEALCVAHPGLGFVLDVFHSWWDPDLEPVLARSIARLTLVQLSGVAQPRDPALLPARCPLSQGCVDTGDLLRLLARCGYRGPYEFELFAHDLDGVSVADAIRRAVDDFAALAA